MTWSDAEGMAEYGRRTRSMPAPPHVIWEDLVALKAEGVRAWVELLPDEVMPTVLHAEKPHLVVWSSLWPSRPDDVVVLDGGLAAWTADGRPVSMEPVVPDPGDWTGSPGHLPVVGAEDVPALARDGVLLDVRADFRFRGEREPIDLIAGHIPGAVNAPLTENTDDLGRFLADDELRDRFAALGVRDGVPMAAYCGSGVTATQTVLALRLAGFGDAALYPGSWSGWITDPDRPIAIGS